MRFNVTESLCLRGSVVMEDRIGWGENYLFVIDGASGLTDIHVTPAGSDAAWLAEELRLDLDRLLPQAGLSLEEILTQSAARLKKAYDLLWDRAGEADYPSAGVSILRLREDRLEYLGLGDCCVALELADGRVEALEETRLTSLDQEVLTQMVRLRKETGQPMSQIREACSDLLIHNRNLRNQAGGYWIFDPTGAGIPHARQKSWPAGSVRGAALMSDGFAQLIRPFGLVPDLPGLYRAIRTTGLASLAEALLFRQQSDRDCLAYPRFKFRDDTTALWATVEESAPAGRRKGASHP